MKCWRISAIINMPLDAYGSPSELKVGARLYEKQELIVNGWHTILEPYENAHVKQSIPFYAQYNGGLPFQPAKLSIFLQASTSEEARALVHDQLENILDDLSFQLHEAVRIYNLEILDVTPPVTVGDTRSIATWSAPLGYGFAKFSRTGLVCGITSEYTPKLSSNYTFESEQIRAALRWYVKGLGAQYDADKFAFFWIALDILSSASKVSVEEPYVSPCNHLIASCPKCGKPLLRKVNGKSVQRFLVEKALIPEKEAKKLWNARQMFHGKNKLEKAFDIELSRLADMLRHACFFVLKPALGYTDHILPSSYLDPMIIKDPQVGGRREITEEDLAGSPFYTSPLLSDREMPT